MPRYRTTPLNPNWTGDRVLCWIREQLEVEERFSVEFLIEEGVIKKRVWLEPYEVVDPDG